MNTFLRIFHPIFSWAFFAIYGLELVYNKSYLATIIIALGLAGLSQTFWKTQLGEKQQYAKADIISFSLGLMAAITHPLLVAWSFLYNP